MRITPNGAQREYYDPQQYDNLPKVVKRLVQRWISLVIQLAKTAGRHNSYSLKHFFEHSTPVSHTLYLTDGEFKGAMLAAGYKPINPEEPESWEFEETS